LIRWSARIAIVAILLVLLAGAPALAQGGEPGTITWPPLWATALAWLVPLGMGLLACGAVRPDRVAAVLRTGWLALGISVIGYWLCGFAFQFGGLGFVSDQPGFAGLAREWTWAPLDIAWGTKWGMLGLQGYMLRGPASTPAALALFFSQLPWITTAVAVPLWSLQGRAKPLVLFISGALIAGVYALLGNWTWGGGWLANLGLNLNLGHGFVDFGGAGAVHLAGAAIALAGMLAFGTRTFMRARSEQLALPILDGGNPKDVRLGWSPEGEPYVPMPPLYLPTLATLGAGLAIVGWIGWALSAPASVTASLNGDWTALLIALLLAVAAGALANLAFSWLVTGRGNALMTARSAVAALIAASAGLPFVPFWASLAVGAGAGLLTPLVQYAIEHVLRFDDPTSAVATHAFPAAWGLLAVGLFADGRAGQGWNQTGAYAYLGVAGQGVAGYLAAPGYISDWPGQFQAQIVGVVAVSIAAFFLSWLLFAAVQGLSRAWQGEYTIRLPRRPRPGPRPRRVPQRLWPRVRFVRSPAAEQEPRAGAGEKRPSVLSGISRAYAALSSSIQALASRVAASLPARRPPAQVEQIEDLRAGVAGEDPEGGPE
jgi:Amt family ammonium transporter